MKFRSQTYNDTDKAKAEVGRVREAKRKEEKRRVRQEKRSLWTSTWVVSGYFLKLGCGFAGLCTVLKMLQT